jgi:hypothetical protein
MKNIYLLPTDNPSKIIKSQDNDFILLNTDAPNWFEINLKTTKQNIYITSDEEIKEGDWCIDEDGLKKCTAHSGAMNHYFQKIILTDNQDLIKDGVQSIDDNFLEWFVKNPSCEEVEIGNDQYKIFNSEWKNFYKIIIPKEDLIPPTKTTEDIKLIGEEPTITITLNKEEARGLMSCLMRTHASGTDLDIGEMVEDKLVEFLNS